MYLCDLETLRLVNAAAGLQGAGCCKFRPEAIGPPQALELPLVEVFGRKVVLQTL